MGMYGAFTTVVEDRIRRFGNKNLKEVLHRPPSNLIGTKKVTSSDVRQARPVPESGKTDQPAEDK